MLKILIDWLRRICTLKGWGLSRRKYPDFYGNINAAIYQKEILQPFLEQGYFEQNGATFHYTQTMLAMVRDFSDDRITSRNAASRWPARSCDLTPCDLFLCPYLKNCIYATLINIL